MNIERHDGTGGSLPPLTRTDVERLLEKAGNASQSDLRLQNMHSIDLSYMDLHGADLRGANLQRANLRGTNLSDTELQEADLSDADLDGADLSHAHLSDNGTHRVKLQRAKLSYATLRGLDLRGFDLAELDLRNTDLNETDLRGALLHKTDLRGADLSTTQLHSTDLREAKLYSDEPSGSSLKRTQRVRTTRQRLTPAQSMLAQVQPSFMQGSEVEQSRQILSDREAYRLGEYALLASSDPVKIRQLFPQGFNFVMARQLFELWLRQAETPYSEEEIHALWIGFAHQSCDLYYSVSLHVTSRRTLSGGQESEGGRPLTGF